MATSFITSLSIVCLLFTIDLVSANIRPTATSASSEDDLYADKVIALNDLTRNRPMLKMTSDRFKTYAKTAQKNYSMIVMFTANAAHRGCSICRQATEEFQIVANSWHYLAGQSQSSRLYFAVADFDDAAEAFQTMGLQSVPIFVHFPPKTAKPKPQDTLDIQRTGFEAESIGKWVSDRTGLNVRIFRPPNYAGTLAVVMLVGLGAVLAYVKRSSLDFLYNRTMWAILVMSIIFTMISGQMWNHIRGPPFMHRNQQNGQVLYVYPSEEGQLGIESLLIGANYAVITLGLILLYEVKNAKDAARKRVLAIAGIAMYCLFFSFLLSIFRSKYQGYPYSFIFK